MDQCLQIFESKYWTWEDIEGGKGASVIFNIKLKINTAQSSKEDSEHRIDKLKLVGIEICKCRKKMQNKKSIGCAYLGCASPLQINILDIVAIATHTHYNLDIHHHQIIETCQNEKHVVPIPLPNAFRQTFPNMEYNISSIYHVHWWHDELYPSP